VTKLFAAVQPIVVNSFRPRTALNPSLTLTVVAPLAQGARSEMPAEKKAAGNHGIFICR
jgi:hypothetical protein